MDKFKIDVIIVTKDRCLQLLECVKHVCANSLKPKNLIIIDSSSNFDEDSNNEILTLSKMKDIKLKYYNISHKGVGFSRNVGLQKVKSPYFSFIDDDEYAPKHWLKNISKIFKSQKNIHVLAGPKIPKDNNNYWHQIWEALLKNEFSYVGKTDTIPSGNSSYLTSFVKRHDLKFDQRFKVCSEDQAFSYELRKNNANMFFHKSVWVKHDCRRNLTPFIKQWFHYGENKHLYHQLYLGSGSIFEPSKICVTYRNFRKTFPYKANLERTRILPGVVLLNTVFLIGFSYSFCCLNKLFSFNG